VSGSFLQSAVFIFGTIDAIKIMMAEKKLESGISQSFDFRGVQMYYHAIADRLSTRSDGSVSAFYFHKAETAGSKRRDGFSYGT
jgi:hypothetical protein